MYCTCTYTEYTTSRQTCLAKEDCAEAEFEAGLMKRKIAQRHKRAGRDRERERESKRKRQMKRRSDGEAHGEKQREKGEEREGNRAKDG